MGETLTHKLIRSHLAEGATHPGEEIAIRMDQALLQHATGTLAWPEFVNVKLTGAFKPWVSAKDVILELLHRFDVKWAKNKVLEYTGPALKELTVPSRGTIANMGTELGATASVFPADGMTKQFLTAQARGKDFKPLVADSAAKYDDTVDIDLGTIEPLIACPSSPDNVKAVSEVAGTEVAQVAVGSSVNSSFRDLSLMAHALDGKHVAPGISMAVSPGSRQTLLLMLMSGLMTKLIKAGVRELEVACGPCIGMGFAPPTRGPSVRTFNRNFEGWTGTADDLVYLCSPEPAAATAVRGVITDPRELGKFPSVKEPAK